MKGFTKLLLVWLIGLGLFGVGLLALEEVRAANRGTPVFDRLAADAPYYIVVDDFNDNDWRENELGEENDCYPESGGTITCKVYSETNRPSALEVAYNVMAPGSYVWLQMEVKGSAAEDLSAMDSVRIVIRGENGGENIEAEFKNCGPPELYPKVEIGDYLTGSGGITTSWRAAVIPFSAFGQISDWSCIDRFSLVARNAISNGIGAGTVYVDDVRILAADILIDDYHDQELENELGGISGLWEETASDYIDRNFVSGALELIYDISESGSGVYWTQLVSTNAPSAKNTLLLDVKGKTGGEEVSIQFEDCGLNGHYHYPKIKLGDYTESGISTDWQPIAIPLVAFSEVATTTDTGMDWDCVTSFAFHAGGKPGGNSGTIYADNVRLVTVRPALPIWVDRFHDGDNECDNFSALRTEWTTGTSNGAILTASTTYTGSRLGDYGCSYRLGHKVIYNQSQAAWTFADLKGLDVSDYDSIELYVKGKSGGEYTNLYLEDRAKRSFDIGIDITDTWQRIVFPLSLFEDNVELTNLGVLKLAFEDGNRSGEIYVDDIKFVQASREYLPIILSPGTSQICYATINVLNDNTGGDVYFTVQETSIQNCVVPNNTTKNCGSILPGSYLVEASATCGKGKVLRTYNCGSQTTRVACQ